MDDLDPHRRLAQRPIQEPSDLEPADAQPLTDLVLGEVQPVVQLGGTEHQSRLPRERLPLARPCRAHRHARPSRARQHAQMCSALLMC